MAAINELRACSTLKQAKTIMSQLCSNDSLSQMLAVMVLATNIKNKNGLVLNFHISSHVLVALIEYATLNNVLLPLLGWNEIVGWCCHYSNIQKFGTRKILLSLFDFLLHIRVNLVFSGIRTVVDLLILTSLEEKDLNSSLISAKILLQFVLGESQYHLICPVIICVSRFVTTSNKVSFEKCLILIKLIAQSNLFNRNFNTGTSYSEVIDILNSEIEINHPLANSNDIRLVNIESKMYEKQYIVAFNKYISSKLLSLWNDDNQISANPRVAAVMEIILNSNHLVVDPVLILNKKDVRLISPNDSRFDFNYILNQSSSIVKSYVDHLLKSNLVWLLTIFETPQYISMQKIVETLEDNIIHQYSMKSMYDESNCDNDVHKLINLIALSLCTNTLVRNSKLSQILSKQFADLFSKFLQSICDSILSDVNIYLSLIIVSWFKIVENVGLKLSTIDIGIILEYVPLLMKNPIIMPWIVSLSFSCKYTMLLSKILHQIPTFLDNCYCDNGDTELAQFIYIFTHVMRANSKMIIKYYMTDNEISTTQQDTKEEINRNIIAQLEESVAANSIYHKYWKFFEAIVKSDDFTVNIRVGAYHCVVEYMKKSMAFRDSMTSWLQQTLVSNIDKDEVMYLQLQVLQSWSILFELHKSNIIIISLYNSIVSSSKSGKILAVYLMKLLYSYIIDESIRTNKTSDYVLAISLPILKKCHNCQVEVMAKLLLSRILNYDSSVFMKIILHMCTKNPLAYAHVDEDGISSLLSYFFEVVNDIELSRVEILLTQEAINNKNLSAAKILHFFKLTEISKKNINLFLNYDTIETSKDDNTLQQILIRRVSKNKRN